MAYDAKTDVRLNLVFLFQWLVFLLPFRWEYIIYWDKSSTAYLNCDKFTSESCGLYMI